MTLYDFILGLLMVYAAIAASIVLWALPTLLKSLTLLLAAATHALLTKYPPPSVKDGKQ